MASEKKADSAIATDSVVVARDISDPADSAREAVAVLAGAVEVDVEADAAPVAVVAREELAGAAATVVNRLLLIEVA